MEEHSRWITRGEVAARTGASVQTLRRWARQGIGPEAVRLGPRLIRYRSADVDAWLAGTSKAAQ